MQNKPRPTLTLKARPGSTEEAFAKTLAGAEALWRETHIESLIERTMQLFARNYAIHSLGLIKIRREDKALRFTGIEACDFLSEAQKSGLRQRLLQIEPNDHDFFEGIHALDLEGQSYSIALLGDSDQDAYALVWLENDAVSDTDAVAVDFLVRQLQTTFRWFSRMTETQTLLHLDDLTGLYNHRYLDVALDREVKRSQRYGSNFSLLFIDLDNFKPVNDTYGHLAGSQVLREVAAIIKATVRDVDLVFRFGGDEFVVILIEADANTGLKTAKRIQERIQTAKFVVAKDAIAQVTSSIGVAAFPEHADQKEKLIAVADECMYESKRRGKNQCVLAQAPSVTSSSSTPLKDEHHAQPGRRR